MEITLDQPTKKIREKTTSTVFPWYIYASLIATTSIITGLLWDVSWHMSIGRDGLFSAPHLAIYLGGILAGIGGAYQLFKTTFAGSIEEKQHSVWFWGFRAPLGALFSIWGALAMLTSAPFDDWWHNAYGLDVEILTPPHVLLLTGMIIIQLGSIITLLTFQNKHHNNQAISPKTVTRIKYLYTFTIGMILATLTVGSWEYMGIQDMHLPSFYKVGCAIFPLFLVAGSRASFLKWPATSISSWYLLVYLSVNWILQLFPATPMLGPIRSEVTHFIPLQFPLLIIFPAVFIDLIFQNYNQLPKWKLSFMLGSTFFVSFLFIQWIFGEFLISSFARNWFFYADATPYFASPDWKYRFAFYPFQGTTWDFVRNMGWAFIIANVSAWIGLSWGDWMTKVKR